MAMLGLFGAIVSACQISMLERNELRSIHWTYGAAIPFFGFALAMFLFYSTVPTILKFMQQGTPSKFRRLEKSLNKEISGSTMLNLSLLTSDMWAVLIRIFAYHEKVDWMYFIAFGAVAVGLVVYSGSDNVGDERTIGVAEASRGVEKVRDEEAAIGNLVPESATAENTSLSTEDGKHQSSTLAIL